MIQDKLLTVPEVAKRLRTSPAAVYRWIYSGKIRALGIATKHLRIPEGELDRIAEWVEIDPTPTPDLARRARDAGYGS